MKPKLIPNFLTVPALVAFPVCSAFALPSQTGATQSDTPFTISNTDFLQTSGATISGSGDFTREGTLGLGTLNNGTYGPQGGANANPNLEAFTAGAGDVVTISFPQTNGVTLNNIVSTAAWDGARGSQNFRLEYQSTVLPGVWQRVATVNHDPGQLAGNTNTQVTITDSTGILAANVSQIRFNYGNTNFWQWNGYREVDATGSVSAAPVGPQYLKSIQINEVFTPSNSDLLQMGGVVTSSVGNFSDEGNFGLSTLNDGSYGPNGSGANGASATGNGGESVTYQLDLTASPGGYDLTGIDVYAGWDGFRGGQEYIASYSLVSDPGNFISFGSLSMDANANNAPGGNISTRSMLRDIDGLLASGVAAVKIDFGNVTFGYAGYREIDVFGAPVAVPEPTAGLLALASLGLVVGRRKR